MNRWRDVKLKTEVKIFGSERKSSKTANKSMMVVFKKNQFLILVEQEMEGLQEIKDLNSSFSKDVEWKMKHLKMWKGRQLYERSNEKKDGPSGVVRTCASHSVVGK